MDVPFDSIDVFVEDIGFVGWNVLLDAVTLACCSYFFEIFLLVDTSDIA